MWGHRPGGGKAGHVRHGRVRAQIQEHPRAADAAAAAVSQLHVDRAVPGEACPAHDDLGAAGPETVQVKLVQAVDHRPLPGLYALHAGRRRLQLHPELGCPHGERADLRRANDVLARQAGDIGAGAADIVPLHGHGAMALARHRPSEVLARLTSADNKNVVILDRRHLPGSSPATSGTTPVMRG